MVTERIGEEDVGDRLMAGEGFHLLAFPPFMEQIGKGIWWTSQANLNVFPICFSISLGSE